jgi:hypothetical protein
MRAKQLQLLRSVAIFRYFDHVNTRQRIATSGYAKVRRSHRADARCISKASSDFAGDDDIVRKTIAIAAAAAAATAAAARVICQCRLVAASSRRRAHYQNGNCERHARPRVRSGRRNANILPLVNKLGWPHINRGRSATRQQSVASLSRVAETPGNHERLRNRFTLVRELGTICRNLSHESKPQTGGGGGGNGIYVFPLNRPNDGPSSVAVPVHSTDRRTSPAATNRRIAARARQRRALDPRCGVATKDRVAASPGGPLRRPPMVMVAALQRPLADRSESVTHLSLGGFLLSTPPVDGCGSSLACICVSLWRCAAK